ncbi:FAS1 domain-containing protein [Heracleum sosnowskyi]|uniref:FAS1 domain-containing protein n=1 Tax=Heracleum sosnowskyi TaxID=360622 RepID=A0AAD8N3Q1_9APIA|nr:FAS1 domain-containing protein [Heracleum sosnowskyi]
MAKYYCFLNPFLLLTTLTILNLCSISATTSTTLPPSNQEVDAIIETLVQKGGFRIWAKLLAASKTRPVFPPNYATLFVPTDAAIARLRYATDMNPYAIACHITPQLLLFSDLCHLKPFSLLSTLVPSKTILITSTLSSNYRLDNALITDPNLYLSSHIAVHGIDCILDLNTQRSTMPPLLRVGNALGAAHSQAGA